MGGVGAPAFDLWLALAAGHRVWSEGQTNPGPRERVAATVAAVAAVSSGAVGLAGAVLRVRQSPDHTTFDQVLIGTAVAIGVLVATITVHYVRIAIGRPGRGAQFWPSLIARCVTFVLLVSAVAGSLSFGHGTVGAVLGILCGADVSLTLWTLGVEANPWQRAREAFFSPVHVGALLALLLAVTTDFGSDHIVLIGLYVAVWCATITALATIHLLDVLAEHFERVFDAYRRDVVERERAHRAHWLHDDVLSEVRLASLRITSGAASAEQIQAELLDLDHRLRLRQLDEMIRDGRPAIYEILQPHLRRAQNLGVRLDVVPTHEVTGVTVSEQDAQLLNRTLSLLMSNAINAGACRLGIEVAVDDEGIEVAVTDDAGGFDFDALPEGRGLHRLMRQLGPGSVRRLDTTDGSRMVARIPHGPTHWPRPRHEVAAREATLKAVR